MLKAMYSSDQQIPYHDKRVFDLWFKVMKWFKPDVIDIVGDCSDMPGISKYSAGKAEEVSFAEYQYAPLTKNFFKQMRDLRPNADIFLEGGNHDALDARIDDYISRNAPALRGLIDFQEIWGLYDLGIGYSNYSDPPIERYGIHFHHGLYAIKGAGNSVSKMMDEFGVSLVTGHSHRIGQVNKTYELRGEILRGYEIGHMANPKSTGMRYSVNHDWQQGFAVAHIEETINGPYPHIQLIQISPDYTCIVDGKKFVA